MNLSNAIWVSNNKYMAIHWKNHWLPIKAKFFRMYSRDGWRLKFLNRDDLGRNYRLYKKK